MSHTQTAPDLTGNPADSRRGLTWHNPETNPPPPLKDVLMAVRGEPEAAEGWMHHDNTWSYATGHFLEVGRVYAWAELPAVPSLKDLIGGES